MGGSPGLVIMGGDSCFWRLWVRIPATYTGWTFFTRICCKIILFVWRDEKEAGDSPLKKTQHSFPIYIHIHSQSIPLKLVTLSPNSFPLSVAVCASLFLSLYSKALKQSLSQETTRARAFTLSLSLPHASLYQSSRSLPVHTHTHTVLKILSFSLSFFLSTLEVAFTVLVSWLLGKFWRRQRRRSCWRWRWRKLFSRN